jgi:PhnB protein
MASRLNPYLNFRDTARQAIEFYQSVFGGELNVSTFGEFQATQDPAEVDKVMHAQLETPSGFTLMAADTPGYMDFSVGTNSAVSLSGGAEDDAELRGYWEKLSEGATIREELKTAPWGDAFGMLTDKFGTPWLINIAGPGNAQG